MPTNPETTQFMEQMVLQLDETIRALAQRELGLLAALGPQRVEELRELWGRTLNRQDELELRRSLDWRDKELMEVWSRQQCAHSTRANVGKIYMRGHGKRSA